MKTILSRMKTLVENNKISGGTLAYVQDVEIVHPEIALTNITIASLPKILLVPVSTVETWIASMRKEAKNIVIAYLILLYRQRESSIIGDSTRPGGQGKGIADFVADFETVFRGHRLSSGGTIYLDKPLDFTSIEYVTQEFGDEGYLIVSAITMECSRIFEQASLPGNV